MSRKPLHPSISPRGMSTPQGAAYVGVSVNTFEKMVRLGHMPGPLQMPGMGRVLYDRAAIDAAITVLNGVEAQ